MNVLYYAAAWFVAAIILALIMIMIMHGPYRHKKKKRSREVFKVKITIKDSIITIIGDAPMALIIGDAQQFNISNVVWQDRKGFPASIDPNTPQKWGASDNGQFVTLVPSADGTGCEVLGNAPMPADAADIQINVTADADLGEGIEAVTAVVATVRVVGGKPISATATLGAVEDQPT